MTAVLQEIERDGLTLLPSGVRVPAHSGIGPQSGEVLRRAIALASPKLACEVGLAFGLSTLYILDAMRQFGDGRLIGMDPAQHDGTWQGGGLHNVQRAGFSASYTFHEAPSQFVLPKLAEAGTRIQFAFIDGWHTFDHALLDFFYLDSMMDVGGTMVLDDVSYPALERLAHFIVTNRTYRFVEGVALPPTRAWRRNLKSIVKRALHPLVRDHQTPPPATQVLERSLSRYQLIALQKTDQDRRSFNHFVPF
jgi:predicted O-methyltransferase YrrM